MKAKYGAYTIHRTSKLENLSPFKANLLKKRIRDRNGQTLQEKCPSKCLIRIPYSTAKRGYGWFSCYNKVGKNGHNFAEENAPELSRYIRVHLKKNSQNFLSTVKWITIFDQPRCRYIIYLFLFREKEERERFWDLKYNLVVMTTIGNMVDGRGSGRLCTRTLSPACIGSVGTYTGSSLHRQKSSGGTNGPNQRSCSELYIVHKCPELSPYTNI